MINDIFRVFGEQTAEILFEIITECMDDYLLKDVGNNGYRFVNAVSDFATHSTPRRKTANYKENIFARTADGNPMIDRAYQLVKAA